MMFPYWGGSSCPYSSGGTEGTTSPGNPNPYDPMLPPLASLLDDDVFSTQFIPTMQSEIQLMEEVPIPEKNNDGDVWDTSKGRRKKPTEKNTPPPPSIPKIGKDGDYAAGVEAAPPPPRRARGRIGKKDRHSKICTAKGPRDRRMRLSLHIARKFFDLQDTLGFDKASKTIEWLLTKSKSAIKDVMTSAAALPAPPPHNNSAAESKNPNDDDGLPEYEAGGFGCHELNRADAAMGGEGVIERFLGMSSSRPPEAQPDSSSSSAYYDDPLAAAGDTDGAGLLSLFLLPDHHSHDRHGRGSLY